MKLLSNDFVRRLEALALLVRKALCAGESGLPRSHLKGGSVEFAGHREYSPGDEWRYIDWNVYGRTDHLFVREFGKEESLTQRILLDASGSMAFGTPSKFDLACQLTAAIAYVSMNEDAPVQVIAKSSAVSAEVSDLRSRAGPAVAGLFQFLEGIEPAGNTTLSRALSELATRRPRRSSIVVISDLLEDGPVREGLSTLAAQGHELTVLQLLGEGIGIPDVERRVRLFDSETGETLDTSLNERTIGSYYAEMDRFCARWQQFARSHGIGYLSFPSSAGCEEVVLGCLRNGCVFRLARQR
jgi:uncharacterized protein (DUF58 family)